MRSWIEIGLRYSTVSRITFICRGSKIERGNVGVGETETSKIPNIDNLGERST